MDDSDSYYQKIMAKSDDRVANWLFMSSIFPTSYIIAAYLIIVIWGQKWMKRQQALELRKTIIAYNFSLVVLSIYMLFEFIMSSWTAPGFNLFCQPVDYSDNPHSIRLVKTCWWFYFSKIIELMDTVFFLLRKKNNQITFLHVYHHSTMPLLWWVAVKFVGGGEAYFSASINSGIHALMYTYYMLSAMEPYTQYHVWWKKYITSLQMCQFWLVLFKSAYIVYANCGYPVEYGYVLIVYMVTHIILFSNFYCETYLEKTRHKKVARK